VTDGRTDRQTDRQTPDEASTALTHNVAR